MRHLDGRLWEQVCRGESILGAAELAAHLRGTCETCEAVIADSSRRDGVDPLDAQVDMLLGRLAPAAMDELAFARVMRRLDGASPSRLKPRLKRTLSMALAAGVAAAVVGAGLLVSPGPERKREAAGEKGSSAFPEIDLSVVVAPGSAGVSPAGLPLKRLPAAALRKAAPGEALSEEDALLLRYRLSDDGYVSVLRVDSANGVETLLDSARLEKGDHDLRVNGAPAAIPLAGLRGKQRIWVLASPRPVKAAELAKALPKLGAAGPELGAGSFEFEVAPAKQ